MQLKAAGFRGRPSKEEYESRVQELRNFLARSYPGRLNTEQMAAATGLHWQTVKKLQGDTTFLLSLPDNIRTWFSRSRGRHNGLEPVRRAILDLHNYTVAARMNRPSLYTYHAALFGSVNHLVQRNSIELKRVNDKNFLALLDAAGWTEYRWANAAGEHVPPLCPEGCAVLLRLADETIIHSVNEARAIIDTGCEVVIPWLPAPSQRFTLSRNPLDYVKQILGLI